MLITPHIANHLGILLDFETKNDAPSTLSTQEIRKLFGLTERECEIISMLSTGAEDKEIVEAPCISGSTFKKHLYNAYKKMDVSSRTQLLILSLQTKRVLRINLAGETRLLRFFLNHDPAGFSRFSYLRNHVVEKWVPNSKLW